MTDETFVVRVVTVLSRHDTPTAAVAAAKEYLRDHPDAEVQVEQHTDGEVFLLYATVSD